MDNEPSISGRFETKFALIDTADASAGVIIVPLVAGKKIRVIAFHLAVAAAMSVNFESNAGGTHITGVTTLAANGGISASADTGLFQTAEGENLVLDSTIAGQIGGAVTYVEID